MLPLRHRHRSLTGQYAGPAGAAAGCPVPGRVTRAGEQGENMDETQDQSVSRPASPGEHDGHRRPVRGKMGEALDQRSGGGQAAG